MVYGAINFSKFYLLEKIVPKYFHLPPDHRQPTNTLKLLHYIIWATQAPTGNEFCTSKTSDVKVKTNVKENAKTKLVPLRGMKEYMEPGGETQKTTAL